MEEIKSKLNMIELPSDVLRKLGLTEDWRNNISDEFLEVLAKVLNQYKDAIRKLERY
jgi:hypothetical protein